MYASDYRQLARQKLSGKWGTAVLVYLLYSLIAGVAGSTFIGWILLAGPMALGLTMFFMAIRDGYTPSIEMLFHGFSFNFVQSMLVGIMVSVFTFLWSLLLFVPGIIKSYAYSMTFYVMQDHPEYTWRDAIAESQRLMTGSKWRLFCLDLSFIGWILLSVLTFGILLLWVVPYMEAAHAEFYQSLKDDDIEE